MVSTVYKLQKLDEPTFTSSRLDPGVFANNLVQPQENHQLQAVEQATSTHGQGGQGAGGGDGTVGRPVNTSMGDGGAGGTTDVVVRSSDVAAYGNTQAPGLFTSAPGEDATMEIPT